MSRKDKIAVMAYKALELYLHVYPKERTKLKKLIRPQRQSHGPRIN